MPNALVAFDRPQTCPRVSRAPEAKQDDSWYKQADYPHVKVTPLGAPLMSLNPSAPFHVSDHVQPKTDFTEQLRILHQYYIILNDGHPVREFLGTEPQLYRLLIEAVKPLQHAFGDKRIIHVRVLSSDEDSILKVAIQLPADFGGDPEHALRSFDDTWWLHNCHRSSGALVFDYEIHDAI